MTSGLALLAHWLVRQKLNRVSYVALNAPLVDAIKILVPDPKFGMPFEFTSYGIIEIIFRTEQHFSSPKATFLH